MKKSDRLRLDMMIHYRRVAISFAVVLAVYWVYALVATPMIEPQVTLVDSDDDYSAPPPSPPKRLELFAHLFAADAWERDNPKVLETKQGMLLFQKYLPQPDGILKVEPFTLILFSNQKPQSETEPAPRPIIMQAPKGALLQFDSPIDVARARFGNLTKGRLLGEITIRSPPSHPGADDDLEIVTNNAQFDQTLVLAPNDVRFRMGRSFGSGRNLSIELAPPETASASNRPAIGGVKLMELAHVDKVHLNLGSGAESLTRRISSSAETDEQPSDMASDHRATPLEITCQGPFRFDFEKSIATFQHQVDVIRLNPEGPSDQLNAELLEIYFSPRQADTTADSDPPSTTDSGVAALASSSLDVRRLVAYGHPVVLRIDSRGATVRGERMEYDVLADRYSLIDEDRVLLEILDQPIRAAWAREIHIRPHEQNRVISLIDNAGVQMTGGGGFTADEMHIWLLETSSQSASALDSPGNTKMKLDRMMASGHVRLDTSQLVGRVDLLEAWFRQVPPATAPPGVSSLLTSGAPSSSGASAAGSSALMAMTPSFTPTDKPPQKKFEVLGELVRIQLADFGAGPVVEEVTVSRNDRGDRPQADEPSASREVRVREIDLSGSGEAPLTITGDVVQVRNGQLPQATMKVVGRPAMVSARGMTMSGGNVQMSLEDNRLWIDGPGEMTLPITRDLQGNPITTPQTIKVSWKQAMDFDGRSVYFYRGVKVLGENQLALADNLEVTLNRRVDFSQPKQADQIDVRFLAFDGGVYLETREIQEGRQTSFEQMQARNLEIDNSSGRLSADGPGWVNSVRRGGGALSSFGSPAAEGGSNDRDSDDGLKYLHVDFQREIIGNIHKREIRFVDGVKTLYGPVDDWDDKLNTDSVAGLGEHGLSITCDLLTVAEMGPPLPDGRRAVELEARGNTIVESLTFTARAERISYAEAKDLLVLEGSNRTDAELIRHPRVGSRTARAAARKIHYWPQTNRVEVDDASLLDLSNFGIFSPQPESRR